MLTTITLHARGGYHVIDQQRLSGESRCWLRYVMWWIILDKTSWICSNDTTSIMSMISNRTCESFRTLEAWYNRSFTARTAMYLIYLGGSLHTTDHWCPQSVSRQHSKAMKIDHILEGIDHILPSWVHVHIFPRPVCIAGDVSMLLSESVQTFGREVCRIVFVRILKA